MGMGDVRLQRRLRQYIPWVVIKKVIEAHTHDRMVRGHS